MARLTEREDELIARNLPPGFDLGAPEDVREYVSPSTALEILAGLQESGAESPRLRALIRKLAHIVAEEY